MKLLYALLVVLAAGVCSAQQPCVGGAHPKNDPNCIPAEQYVKQQLAKPAPLKCGKWEHVVRAPRPGESWIAYFCPEGLCQITSGKDRCAPLMHAVKEKEWQELMERLKRLEHPPASTTLPWPPTSAPSH